MEARVRRLEAEDDRVAVGHVVAARASFRMSFILRFPQRLAMRVRNAILPGIIDYIHRTAIAGSRMPSAYDVIMSVHADRRTGAYRPLWNWFGYDEPNYTYTK